jgi:glycosyltransferase involved in cell wall biosynthesis
MRTTSRKRLSICYAAPGQNLLPTAGPTRNVLSVAEALSQWADVTVAFRHILAPIDAAGYRVIAIQPSTAATAANHRDDTATRGFYPLRHLSYCRTLRSFARQQASTFDVVLEKGWRLSGFLSAAFLQAGVPAALVENAVALWLEPVDDVQSLAKYVLHRAAHAVTNSCSRRVPIVIAETDELKAMMVAHRGILPDRVRVVGLGVDHRVFRPSDQRLARESLGIGPNPMVVLYVGGIDEYHDLEPVIEAMGQVRNPPMEFHVAGDGEHRMRAEAAARSAGIAFRFHGRVPHEAVPRYIAAADLCIAPYRTSAFHDGLITFATLKIPEYMACGRPVVSVPSPAIRRLIADGVNGYVFPNDVASWVSFLREVPSREHLARMGRTAAETVASMGWDDTARRYFEVCEQLASDPSDVSNDVQ